MPSKPQVPESPRTPAALEQALEQSHEVKTKVESCADDLALTSDSAKQALAAGGTTLPAKQTLAHTEAVETKIQECADDLDGVTKTLARGVGELKLVEKALSGARQALAETKASLHSAQDGEARANLRALHDANTGLPNRSLFDDRLAHALALAQRHDWTLAVMFLDLDHFKAVNDTHGHAAGDAVLQEVAKRLAQYARDEDTVCRNGGDEFLYLLVNPKGRANVERVAAAILEHLGRSIRAGEQQLTIRPSIGIAIYPGGGSDGATLIQNADAAMYRAKASGKGYEVHEAANPFPEAGA